MRANDIIIGEKYHLKTAPSFPWIKALEVLPPKTRENIKNYILVKCIHSSTGWNDSGFIRYFKPRDIMIINSKKGI